MTNEELVSQIQNGDTGLLAELWRQNRGLLYRKASFVLGAAHAAGRYDVDIDDLMQAAYLGLAEAAERYDPAREVKFTTILDLTLRRAFARCTGLTNKQKHDPLNGAASLDAPLGDSDEDGTLYDIVPDEDIDAFIELEERLSKAQLYRLLDEAVEALPVLQGRVIRLRYYQNRCVPDMARLLGMSEQQVQRQRVKALAALRKALRKTQF